MHPIFYISEIALVATEETFTIWHQIKFWLLPSSVGLHYTILCFDTACDPCIWFSSQYILRCQVCGIYWGDEQIIHNKISSSNPSVYKYVFVPGISLDIFILISSIILCDVFHKLGYFTYPYTWVIPHLHQDKIVVKTYQLLQVKIMLGSTVSLGDHPFTSYPD